MHGITDNDGAVYVGRPAWHKLGTVKEQEWAATHSVRDLMVEAGLLYDVKPLELFGVVLVPMPNGEMKEVVVEFPGFVGVYRDDDKTGLHIHQAGYTIGQNEELADLLDGINAAAHDGNVLRPEAAVSMFGGKVVAVTAKFTEEITLTGGDKIEPYIVARTSHDGSYATGVRSNMFRVECRNLLNASLRGKAMLDISFKHTEGREQALAAGKDRLALAINDVRNFQAEANAMIEQAVTDAEFRAMVDQLLPVPDNATDLKRGQVEQQRAAIMGVWSDDPRVGNYRRTAWGAYQAVSTFEQWVVPGRKVEERNMKAYLGKGFGMTNKLPALLPV